MAERQHEEMRTIDGVPIVQGLAVFDYNLDAGTIDLTRMSDTGWFDVILARGGRSLMNASRVWTREPYGGTTRAVDVVAELTGEPVHTISYGISNSATCTCGWTGHGTLAEDLDREVTRHLAVDEQ